MSKLDELRVVLVADLHRAESEMRAAEGALEQASHERRACHAALDAHDAAVKVMQEATPPARRLATNGSAQLPGIVKDDAAPATRAPRRDMVAVIEDTLRASDKPMTVSDLVKIIANLRNDAATKALTKLFEQNRAVQADGMWSVPR